uniref:Putative chemosensory protein 7 n=1 Tax=Lygus lineolaris TaxID=50650 RepID=A0A2D0W2C2_LYGLI|nr:putative chemosensory protein 7 [Lygus lineolaris]
MRIIISAILVALTCGLASCEMTEQEFYEKVFEEVDPDFILDNERILTSYLKCFYSEIECNAHAEVMKKSIPDVLATVCGRCSDKQKGIFKYSLNKFVPAHPKDWERILSIYDPTGEAWPKVKAFMES